MKKQYLFCFIAMFIIISCGLKPPLDYKADREEITKVIENSIGWALEKDFDLLYSCFVQDSTFFIYHPDSASTIYGFEAFRNHAERIFGNDKFKATGFEVKNLQIVFSDYGETAWYSCLLDDFGEWDGQPFAWNNCRWTGVLDKRKGKWVIAQMHFSFPQ